MLEMSPLWNIQLRSVGGKKPQKWQPENNNNNKSHCKPRFRQADGIEMSQMCVWGGVGGMGTLGMEWGEGEAEGVNSGHSAQPVH